MPLYLSSESISDDVVLGLTSEQQIKFWNNVSLAGQSECWNYKVLNNKKRGVYQPKRGISLLAYRIAYILTKGRTFGLKVLHNCDNPSCCNPSHLKLGTYQDNSDDKVARGRQPKGVTHGMVAATEDQIRKAKEMLLWFHPTKEVARATGLTYFQVKHLRAGATWVHLE